MTQLDPVSGSRGGQAPSRRTPSVGTAWAAWTAAALVIIVAVLSTVTLGRPENLTLSSAGGPGHTRTGGTAVTGDSGSGDTTGGSGGTTGSGAGTDTTAGSGAAAAAGGGHKQTGPLACNRSQNGGNTDTGVSANSIKLAATVVKSGVGQAFLGDVEFGMLAVMNRINRQGGVCGRQLSLTLNDDGWSAQTGKDILDKYIQEGYFALAVVPSSEGLHAAVGDGDIDRAGVPVVGTDGMIADQYTDPWVWPVSTSTVSFMHIMAKNAYDRGARTFAIVYDNQYRFGIEGDAAYKGAISRLSGATLLDNCNYPVQAGLTSYKNDVQSFNGSCDQADFVALLLEPETAAQWIKDGGYLGTAGKRVGAGGPQTLFTRAFGEDFANNCNGDQCQANFWVWTGFHPPAPPDDTIPAVSTFVNEMNSTNSSADHDNQFVEGGYLGMELLVQGLQKVGPNLTRGALKQALDAMDFNSGLTGGVEQFRPGNHFANVSAQAFSLVISTGHFNDFRYQQTGFLADPWVGKDIG